MCAAANGHFGPESILCDDEVSLGVLDPILVGDEIKPVFEGELDGDIGSDFHIAGIDGFRGLERHILRTVADIVLIEICFSGKFFDMNLKLFEIFGARAYFGIGRKTELDFERL